MKNDFFISYSSEDLETVECIVDSLERRGLKCWYAPRDVMGRYAKAIVEAIDNSRVFLICLSKHSVISDHVLNEVEMVYNKMRSSNSSIIIEPLCLEELDMDSPEYDEIMYYIRRINFISPKNYESPNSIADEVYNKNRKALKLDGFPITSRENAQYIPTLNEQERLRLQNEMLRDFDQEIYDEVFSDRGEADILDVGCGNADVIFDRLQHYNGNYRIIGIERDSNAILEGQAKHENDSISFLKADVENAEFIDDLMDFMDEQGVEGFDVIHISMFLLYLKDIGKLLRRLKRLLNPNGVFLIKDIDDGINYAFPDNEKLFENAYKICAKDKNSGYRQNGRQIPHYLLKAGVENIKIRKQGLTTLNMDVEKREALFNLYFKPILADLEQSSKMQPDDIEIVEDLEWYRENYEKLHSALLNPEFVFSLGIMIFVASV